MLKHFEDFDGHTKKAAKWLRWLLMELYNHDIENPVTSRSIKTMTTGPAIGVKGLSGVEVRSMVHFLREEGYPIGSRGGGYYWCRNQADIKVTNDHLDGRINSIMAVRNAMDRVDLDKSPSNVLHMGQIGMAFMDETKP